jgi:hypothetical protein
MSALFTPFRVGALELPRSVSLFQSWSKWLPNRWNSLPFHLPASSQTRSKAGRPPLILSCSEVMCGIGSGGSGPSTIVSASPTLSKQGKLRGRLSAGRAHSSRLRRRSARCGLGSRGKQMVGKDLRVRRRFRFAQDWTPTLPLPENKCCVNEIGAGYSRRASLLVK